MVEKIMAAAFLWEVHAILFLLTLLAVVATFVKRFGLEFIRLWRKHLLKLTTHYFLISEVFAWVIWGILFGLTRLL
ncbi:hypothetical protein DRO27_05475 [Candidatus Bathyarchaeota archaeon]|nr:MAG: hypothetical protein DRO27_05475 [Candidatus Bathyarchaeota archaeon]